MVSVVMLCYNHEKYIAESIESILQQTYQDFELIIVENGSTDSCREIIKKYAKNEKVRAFYFDRNDCIEGHKLFAREANGKYIAGATSDDIWLSDKLEKQVFFLEEHPEYHFISTWAQYCDQEMKPIDHELNGIFQKNTMKPMELLAYFWKYGNCICYPSSMGRSEIYKEMYIRDFSYWQLTDLESWCIFTLEGFSIYIYPEILVKMRKHKDAISFSSGASFRAANESASLKIAIFETISDEQFVEAFESDLINKNIKTHEDVICEKILILFKAANSFIWLHMLIPDFFYRYYPQVKNNFEKVYGLDQLFFKEKMAEMGTKAILTHCFAEGYKEALSANNKGEQ